MANSIHISYDLRAPGKNYDDLIEAIKGISGRWAKIHLSFWYVNAQLSSAQVLNLLLPHIDKNDSVYVVDATNNTASWHNIDERAAVYIRDHWNK